MYTGKDKLWYQWRERHEEREACSHYDYVAELGECDGCRSPIGAKEVGQRREPASTYLLIRHDPIVAASLIALLP